MYSAFDGEFFGHFIAAIKFAVGSLVFYPHDLRISSLEA